MDEPYHGSFFFSQKFHHKCLIRFYTYLSVEALGKIFAIFTGKHLCWSLFLIKVFRPAALLKREYNVVAFL